MRLLREYIRNLLTEANGTVPPDFDGFMAEYESMSQQNPLNPGQQLLECGTKRRCGLHGHHADE